MNDAPNFSSLLDDTADHVERPKGLPTGTYIFSVGRWEEGKSSKKKTPFVRFAMTPISAEDDVDPDELAEALTNGNGEVGALDQKKMSITFYVTAEALYRLVEFHEHCGLDLSEELSHRQRNDEVLGTQVRGYVAPRENDDPNAPVYVEIKRTLPAD